MLRQLLVLVAICGLSICQPKDYNMTFNDTVAMVQGLFKSLKVSDDQESITKCAHAGIDYKDLVEHDFSGIISSSELGPQINQALLANLTRDFFSHTTLTVQECGNLSVGVYKLVIKLFKFVISGDAWMAALRRLKDDGFTILGSLGVGFRMLDDKKFYEAGIEFGNMAQMLLFGDDKLRMVRMLAMKQGVNMYEMMRARRLMRHFQKYATIMLKADKSVWQQILDGFVAALDDSAAVEDGKKCVKSVLDTGDQLKNINWKEQQSVENVTATINATGINFVNVVDRCTQGVNKVIRVGGVSVDFFKKLTGKNVLSVLYEEMQMIVDSDIDAFKMIYENGNVENATLTLTTQVLKVLKLIRANELK